MGAGCSAFGAALGTGCSPPPPAKAVRPPPGVGHAKDVSPPMRRWARLAPKTVRGGPPGWTAPKPVPPRGEGRLARNPGRPTEGWSAIDDPRADFRVCLVFPADIQ